MHNLLSKLRVIYVPFLLIVLSFVLGYTFLNWFLLIKTELIVLDEALVNLWLPFGLSWIPVLLWLRPRLKALRLTGGNGNLPFLFQIVAALAIAAPTIISQLYLATAAGEITPLQRISQINQGPKTKYYTVQDVFFDKINSSVETRMTLGGKHNEYLNAAIFVACPLADSADSSPPSCTLWLGTLYTQQTNSRLTDSDRDKWFRTFLQASEASYNQADLRNFTYLERVGANENHRGFNAALTRNNHYRSEKSNTVLVAHLDKFEERNGSKLEWIFGSLGIGAFVWLVMLVCAPVKSAEMNRLLDGGAPNNDRGFEWFWILIPTRHRFGLPLLIDLNLLVFLGMVFTGLGVVSFNGRDLLALGANFRPAVLDGQIWRLVTSMFIHGGLMHLAGNVLGLFLISMLLESVIGSAKFTIYYFVTGVVGSIASVVWHKATISIGASGAIFGLWGVLIGLSLIKKAKAPMSPKQVLLAALFMLGYSLLIGLVSDGIDNACHLGGLACGILLGLWGGLQGWPAKQRALLV